MEVVEKRCGNEEGLVRSLRDGGLKKRERVGLGRKKSRRSLRWEPLEKLSTLSDSGFGRPARPLIVSVAVSKEITTS